MLVAMVGFFMLLSIAPAPDLFRMAASVLPALILLGWLIDSPRKLARALVSHSHWEPSFWLFMR